MICLQQSIKLDRVCFFVLVAGIFCRMSVVANYLLRLFDSLGQQQQAFCYRLILLIHRLRCSLQAMRL